MHVGIPLITKGTIASIWQGEILFDESCYTLYKDKYDTKGYVHVKMP